MMDEAGFIIDQSLQDCRKQTEDLKKEKDCLKQHRDAINAKKKDNDQLMKDVDVARKYCAETLKAELDSQTEASNEAEQGSTKINTARFLMEFLKEDAVKAFTEYIEEQEQAYGPLVDRVNRIKRRQKVLAVLEIEAEEIKDQGNIIAYKKQATIQGPNTISEE